MGQRQCHLGWVEGIWSRVPEGRAEGAGREPAFALPRVTCHSWVQVIKVYSEDGTCRSVEVAAGATARYVCEMLVHRSHSLSDENWGLVECHPYLALGKSGHRGLPGPGGSALHSGLGRRLIQDARLPSTDPYFLPMTPERALEDHESVAEVQAAWPIGGDSRIVFRKNFAKYELFKSTPVSVCNGGVWARTPQPPARSSVPDSWLLLPPALPIPRKDGL